MPAFLKRTARREEIRRSKLRRRGSVHGRFLALFRPGTVLLAVTAALAVGAIINVGGEVLDIREGQNLARTITSRVAFQLEDQQATTEKRLRERDTAPNYYRLDTSLIDAARGRLVGLLALARASGADAQKLRDEAAASRLTLNDANVTELQRLASDAEAAEYTRAVDLAVREIKSNPLVEPVELGVRRGAAEAILLDPSGPGERRIPWSKLRFASAREVNQLIEEASRYFREDLRGVVRDVLIGVFQSDGAEDQVHALYRYDSAASIVAGQRAMERVAPQYRSFAAGYVLADEGPITGPELVLLKSEQQAWEQLRALQPFWQRMAWPLSRAVLAAIVVLGLIAHLTRQERRYLRNTSRQVLSCGILLIVLAWTRIAFVWFDLPSETSAGFQALAAGLLAIVYPSAVALAMAGALAVLTTIAVQQQPAFIIVLMLISGMMVFGLRDIRVRGRIVLVGLFTAAAAIVVNLLALFLSGQPPMFALSQSAWAGLAVLLAGFVLEGVLPAIERLFQLSTSMTLLEWCDASKPLMKLLATEAPGTYNHSLLVGTLAESAAASIGANGLQARAGAYYHDAGKINKPEYFVENQVAGASRHQALSPAMSLLIIIGHVKDGIEMAKEYHLPASLRPFIAQHHGTTLVEYFYHAASSARRVGEAEVAEVEFRYPGPRPQSREVAIVMLCDAVEGAVRAMAEPTPGRIEAVVNEVAQKRLLDGQFDECDMTFRELSIVEKSLVKSLCGIYHARVAYPHQGEPSADRTRHAS